MYTPYPCNTSDLGLVYIDLDGVLEKEDLDNLVIAILITMVMVVAISRFPPKLDVIWIGSSFCLCYPTILLMIRILVDGGRTCISGRQEACVFLLRMTVELQSVIICVYFFVIMINVGVANYHGRLTIRDIVNIQESYQPQRDI